MLRDAPLRAIANDLDRRWLFDDYFDLIVWYASDGTTYGFQLCYDKNHHERALTWTRDTGFRHTGIESGESQPTVNRTPILVEGTSFPAEIVRGEFLARSEALPTELRNFVLAKLAAYPDKTTV